VGLNQVVHDFVYFENMVPLNENSTYPGVNFIALTLINTDNWIDYIEINPSLPHIHQTQNKHVEQCVSFKYHEYL